MVFDTRRPRRTDTTRRTADVDGTMVDGTTAGHGAVTTRD
eukprot:gene21983-18502_t